MLCECHPVSLSTRSPQHFGFGAGLSPSSAHSGEDSQPSNTHFVPQKPPPCPPTLHLVTVLHRDAFPLRSVCFL